MITVLCNYQSQFVNRKNGFRVQKRTRRYSHELSASSNHLSFSFGWERAIIAD